MAASMELIAAAIFLPSQPTSAEAETVFLESGQKIEPSLLRKDSSVSKQQRDPARPAAIVIIIIIIKKNVFISLREIRVVLPG